MNLNPDIFKAYDGRGIYPGEVNEDAARAIGAAFVVYLKAARIAVSPKEARLLEIRSELPLAVIHF